MDLFDRLSRSFLSVLLFLAVSVTAAYSFMLHAPFRGMDDFTSIVENQDIRDFKNLPRIFTGSFFGDKSYYRPLVSFTYMLEYHAFGLNAFWYNLDNVLLHIINSFCVFLLIGRLWKNPRTAFWVCLLFAVHPVQWEAVANISGRAILLNTFFVLTAFILFINFNERRRAVSLLGSLFCFLLALFCKESAAILPVVCLLYLWLFPSERKKSWFAVVPFFLLVFGFILLRRQLGITELFGWGSLEALMFGVLTFARGVITYLRLFVFPSDLYFDRSLKVFTAFTDPQAIGAILFWLASLCLFLKNFRKIDGKVNFLVLWFLVELAPVSQIVTSLGVQPGFISLAEHFLYVPSIAMLTILVIGAQHLWRLNEERKFTSPSVSKIALAGILAFFYLTTIQQTLYARNELSMLKRSVDMQPFNSRVQYSIGMYYVRRAMFPEAEIYFRQAALIDPWNVRTRIALGKSLCDQGRYVEGMAVYSAIRNPGHFEPLLRENMRLSQIILNEKTR